MKTLYMASTPGKTTPQYISMLMEDNTYSVGLEGTDVLVITNASQELATKWVETLNSATKGFGVAKKDEAFETVAHLFDDGYTTNTALTFARQVVVMEEFLRYLASSMQCTPYRKCSHCNELSECGDYCGITYRQIAKILTKSRVMGEE
ncbi:hypothetical protein [Halodesulfovibrio aestuarii]|uniref:hypothetical protein n=1 Tax=Halodesulfovibrio aestuarii TaxID=126333 RepID=UPI003D342086